LETVTDHTFNEAFAALLKVFPGACVVLIVTTPDGVQYSANVEPASTRIVLGAVDKQLSNTESAPTMQ
jgi:hypothetical protein